MEPYTRSGSVKVRSWGSKPFGELSPRRDFFEVLHYSRNHDNLVDLHLRHFDPGYAVLPRPLELEALGGEGDPSRLLPRPDLYHDQLHWRDVVGEVEPIGKRKPGPFSSKSAPANANLVGGIWFDANRKERGPAIWGEFITIQEVYNDPCTGFRGIQGRTPVGPGLGKW
jgi:hypothetical protein